MVAVVGSFCVWELESVWSGWVDGGCGGEGGAVTVVLSIASGGGAARGVWDACVAAVCVSLCAVACVRSASQRARVRVCVCVGVVVALLLSDRVAVRPVWAEWACDV